VVIGRCSGTLRQFSIEDGTPSTPEFSSQGGLILKRGARRTVVLGGAARCDDGHGDAGALRSGGAACADPRGLRQPCPFLLAVLVAVAEYRVEQRVLPDAARAGNGGRSARIERSNSNAPSASTTASVHRAEQ
jgi:hypothetical protein